MGTAPPLVFGSSWHEAMDCVWGAFKEGFNGDTESLAKLAFMTFCEKWEAEGMTPLEQMDDFELKQLKARTPMTAYEMIFEYIAQREKFLREITILDIEPPFAVPLDPDNPDLWYVGRLDKIWERRGDIYAMEHKTTSLYSTTSTFRSGFVDSFSPNSQIDGYIHAGNMLYGDKFKGVWVDAALVHLKVHDGFKIIPVDRIFKQIDGWLYETHYWIDQIDLCHKELEEAGGNFMPTFPKNTNACSDFGGCPYMNICRGYPNPSEQHEAPAGFIEKPWSPFDVLHLEKLGLDKGKDDGA